MTYPTHPSIPVAIANTRQRDETPPSRALVNGLARVLKIDVQILEKLADEVRRDVGAKWFSMNCGDWRGNWQERGVRTDETWNF
jgi:hypothetical protein